MAKAGNIEHAGIINEISEDTIKVKIAVSSACSSCKANILCGAESGEKIIEVKRLNNDYFVGEEVMLYMKESLGFKALFLGYIMPFVLVVAILIIMITITGNEAISGLVSLGGLIPYFFVLYFLRDRFKKVFLFEISKVF